MKFKVTYQDARTGRMKEKEVDGKSEAEVLNQIMKDHPFATKISITIKTKES